MPADGLVATVARFNDFVEAGVDADFHRGEEPYDRAFSDGGSPLVPIEKGPFRAAAFGISDLGTKGGLRTDASARVLDRDGNVIQGLYAAGNSMAAVSGTAYPGRGQPGRVLHGVQPPGRTRHGGPVTGVRVRPLAESVVVVTGASRGAGKGIALALGEAGATVYVTGRSRREGDAALPGSVFATAEEIERRGGTGVPVVCDHADDSQVAELFDRVRQEHGRLDVLVNNAYVVPDRLSDKGPFWEKPLALQQQFDVGLRSSYVSSYHAAPLLVDSGTGGLVVNTSSFGGRCYMHGPAYGAVKAGIDKMAHDMAVDFRPHGVAVVSIWMGLLLTERTRARFAADPDRYGSMTSTAESPEFTGRVIAALAEDPGRMSWSGQILVGAEVGAAYGVTDVDGSKPTSPRGFLGDPTRWNAAVVD